MFLDFIVFRLNLVYTKLEGFLDKCTKNNDGMRRGCKRLG